MSDLISGGIYLPLLKIRNFAQNSLVWCTTVFMLALDGVGSIPNRKCEEGSLFQA
jgi:hypothetical protein